MAEKVGTNIRRRRLFSKAEAAEYLNRSESWLEKKAAGGEIPYYKLGPARGRRVPMEFDVADLDAYIDKFRQGAESA